MFYESGFILCTIATRATIITEYAISIGFDLRDESRVATRRDTYLVRAERITTSSTSLLNSVFLLHAVDLDSRS